MHRHSTALLTLTVLTGSPIIFTGCPAESDPAKSTTGKSVVQAPPTKAPPAPPTVEKGRFKIPKAGTQCTYELKDVQNETLGESALGGHQLTLKYTVTAQAGPADQIKLLIEAKHVESRGRREKYHVRLDSDKRADRVRVAGGAETTLMFEMVSSFALLDQKLEVLLDKNGRLISLKGGDKVRAALLKMFPPKPRESPHAIEKVNTLMSDEALVRYLLPGALLAPPDGELKHHRRTDREFELDLPHYAATGKEATRATLQAHRWLLKGKTAYGPIERKSKVPAAKSGPTIGLLKATIDTTVQFDPENICFSQGGMTHLRIHAWEGFIEERKQKSQQNISRILIWTRK